MRRGIFTHAGKPKAFTITNTWEVGSIFHPGGIKSIFEVFGDIKPRWNANWLWSFFLALASEMLPESIHRDSQMLWYCVCIACMFLINSVWSISDTNKLFFNSRPCCEPKSTVIAWGCDMYRLWINYSCHWNGTSSNLFWTACTFHQSKTIYCFTCKFSPILETCICIIMYYIYFEYVYYIYITYF